MLSHHNLISICEMLRLHNTDNWRGEMREVFFPVGLIPFRGQELELMLHSLVSEGRTEA